ASASNRAARRLHAWRHRAVARARRRAIRIRPGKETKEMIEAIQVAVDAAQANPAASPAAQPQATMFEVNQFAEAYGRGGSTTGGANAVAAPAQPPEGMRALMSTFENLNAGADKISAMSHMLT